MAWDYAELLWYLYSLALGRPWKSGKTLPQFSNLSRPIPSPLNPLFIWCDILPTGSHHSPQTTPPFHHPYSLFTSPRSFFLNALTIVQSLSSLLEAIEKFKVAKTNFQHWNRKKVVYNFLNTFGVSGVPPRMLLY